MSDERDVLIASLRSTAENFPDKAAVGISKFALTYSELQFVAVPLRWLVSGPRRLLSW